MDNNPFKPSSYENKNTSAVVDVPGFDFYPSTNTYNQNSSSGGIGAASTSSTARNFGFGEDPPVLQEGANQQTETTASDKSILSHPVWTWKFWQSFFDVDTSDVLRRIFFSFAPWPRYLKSESVDIFIGVRPDLYGPFWICSTLVFVIAVLGNIASYFQSHGECVQWNYNFTNVYAAAITIFIYVWVLPIFLWTVLWWRNAHGTLKLSGALCLYGYSMFLYIPVSFLWLINIMWLQWALALTAATLSGFILAYVFWNHLHFSHGKLAALTALIVFLLHLGLGFGFVTYFFHYQHADCAHPAQNSTESTSTIYIPGQTSNSTVAQASAQTINQTINESNFNFSVTDLTITTINTTISATELSSSSSSTTFQTTTKLELASNSTVATRNSVTEASTEATSTAPSSTKTKLFVVNATQNNGKIVGKKRS